MTKLTEHTVLARTRAQDLRSVRKLNAWGSELTDVSIVKKLPNVEVLSLSVNSISSLEDFSHCDNLQELYIRKNNIAELGEIRFLKDLPKLRNLWLADNPCAESEDYRLTVIRALPQLQKLDNLPIRPDEVESAKKHGSPLELLIPRDESEEAEARELVEERAFSPHGPPGGERQHQQVSSHYEESVTHTESFSAENTAYSPANPNNGEFHVGKSVVAKQMNNHVSQATFQDRNSHEYYSEREDSLQQSHTPSQDSSPGAMNSNNYQQHEGGYDRDCDPEWGAETPSGSREHTFSPKCGFPPPYMPPTRMQAQQRPTAIRLLPKGGKSRAANILSAVLCLIKELDWASLEVVDTAIHCQMEEMEEHHSSS